jgi:hypothetical protein
MKALQTGIDARAAIRQAPILEALQKQKLANAQRGAISPLQRGQGVVTQQDGNAFIQTPVFNPSTGEVNIVSSPISGSLTSRMGETPQQKSAREIMEAEEKRRAQLTAEQDLKPGIEADIVKSKAEQELKFKPRITSAVKLAEKAAAERGDVLTDLDRMTAAMPGLEDVVSDLRELAPIATSTLGGKLFDGAVKQTGFGSTKGATARAKFIAIIDNQVLPLLKPTFGAAFTVQEGEALRATLGNPDSSPEEKIAQLDAFLAQKVRDVESKGRQLGAPQADVQQGADIQSLSNDDLLSF